MAILNDGSFSFCRWSTDKVPHKTDKIQNQHPIQWFQQSHKIASIRKQFLQGQTVDGCEDCTLMEEHKKVSGRQKQLLKNGINTNNFSKTFQSSRWLPIFKNSIETGYTDQQPVDWQIDLGNYCNSACVFCAPSYSSRIASEYKTIGIMHHQPIKCWADDEINLNKFLNALEITPNLKYIHFIGGEPLIMPNFKKILKTLINLNLQQKVTLGFTTNLTVFDLETIDLLKKFDVHIGVSIECLTELNDYVRYGSKIETVKENLSKFLNVSKEHGWVFSIRTTPTFLTVQQLLPLYQYALENKVHIESCNFMTNPEYLKPNVLPNPYRSDLIAEIKNWIKSNCNLVEKQIINVRSNYSVENQILQDAESYVNYFEAQQDESFRLPVALSFLQKLEQSRKNKIIDYLPEYENLFRSAGYNN